MKAFFLKTVNRQLFNKTKNHWQHFFIITITNYFLKPFKISSMGNLLYIIAVILVIAWAIGFLGYHAGGLIHILLVVAIIAVLLKVIRGSAE